MRLQPKKSLGQHFLIDKNIQAKIIQACELDKGDTVLEIGPGRGELTQYLLSRTKRVIAVEIDNHLYQDLKEKFSSFKNLVLLNANILKINLVDRVGQQGLGKVKVIANIPYYISTPIIARLLRYKKYLDVIFLTLQKEFAERLTAHPGNKDYGALSCFVQFYTNPRVLFSISRSAFWPAPKVDSCFVRLRILPRPSVEVKNEELFFGIIRTAFNQRRKFLKNNLVRMFPQSKVMACLQETGLGIDVRAEDLSLSDFAKVADYFVK